MSFLRRLRSLVRRNAATTFPKSRCRPTFELLEDRTLPAASLVKDINVLPMAITNAERFITVGATSFFVNADPATGKELWRTENASATGALVKDINPGGASANPASFIEFNGALYFTATSGTQTSLWRSDGTIAGTTLVRADLPADRPFVLNGKLILFATRSEVGASTGEVWSSDGTAAGTQLIRSGPGTIGEIIASNQRLWFTTIWYDAVGRTRQDVWVSDGTAAGTVALKADGNVDKIWSIGTTLYFATRDLDNAASLWKTDGTLAGTVAVSPGLAARSVWGVGGSIYVGDSSGLWKLPANGGAPQLLRGGFSHISQVEAVNGKVIFTAATGDIYSLWVSDGTPAGTTLLRDGFTSIDQFWVIGNMAVFRSLEPTGWRLWRTDGTTAGTTLVRPELISVDTLRSVNGQLLFSAATMVGAEQSQSNLWRTDGTTAGTVFVVTTTGARLTGASSAAVVINNALYFGGSDGVDGGGLWKSDGTTAGTVLLRGGIGVRSIWPAGATIFFQDNDGWPGKLWKSDGTAAGTRIVFSTTTQDGWPDNFNAINGLLYFRAFNGTSWGVWRTDGTTAGTVLLRDGLKLYQVWAVGNVTYFTADDGTYYFDGPMSIWRTDGTAAGTVLLKDHLREVGTAAVFGNRFFIPVRTATDDRRPLISDGTAAGTTPLPNGGEYLGTLGSDLLFTTYYNDTSSHLDRQGVWRTDGTAAGTVLLRDNIAPGTIAYVNGAIYYMAQGQSGWALWKNNGTPGGNVRLRDNLITSARFIQFGNILIFGGGDGTTDGLWRTDGTPNGTQLVRANVWPDATKMWLYNGKVIFVGGYNDLATGQTHSGLWQTDGTTAGTVLLRADVSSWYAWARIVGTAFYLMADGPNGRTLWRTDGTVAGTVAIVENVGGGADFAVTGGVVVHPASASVGPGIWATDGTTGNSVRLSTSANGLWQVGANVLFGVPDNSDVFLYRTDGTVAGTGAIQPGLRIKEPELVGQLLYFQGNDGTGWRLWRSDGTAAGTVVIGPDFGAAVATAAHVTELQGRLFFAAIDAAHGMELWTATPTPATPTGLTAVAGVGQVTLSWNAVPGASSYNVYRVTASGADAATPLRTGLSGATFTDTGLSGSPTYYYRISAVNAGGESLRSSEVSATPRTATDVIWVDDALPAGAVGGAEGGDGWTWISTGPSPFAGTKAHQSNLAAGQHQHFFTGATNKLLVQSGDQLFAYVYLDPANPPTEIMLQWRANGSWDHRAYWGANSITWGTNGTNSCRAMGPLPMAGGWVRLEVSAALVGLEGLAVDGMAFSLFGGRATWDRAGKSSSAATPPAAPVVTPAIVGSGQVMLGWTAIAGATTYNVYRSTGSASSVLVRSGLTATSFTDTGLTNGTTYFYRVTAVSAAGESARSNEVAGTPLGIVETVWIDDALPTGAVMGAEGGDGWTWISTGPAPFAGAKAHQSNLATGQHQHYFTGATNKLVVQQGDMLFGYVYLDPANPPSEVMLQWRANGSWEHRAFWGADRIPAWGTIGTASRRAMGTLPPMGGWVRLEVSAAEVGLEGMTVDGMAFTLFGGRATWDKVGKAVYPPSAPPPRATLESVTGSAGQVTVSWSYLGSATSYNIYRSRETGGSGGIPYRSGVTGTSLIDTDAVAGERYNYYVEAVNAFGKGLPSNVVSILVPPNRTDTIWFDDALPAGAVVGAAGGDAWNWVNSPAPSSGALAHQSNLAAGMHQHFFTGATNKMVVQKDDILFAYVYLDPANPPTEIMLQWYANGSWENRAYWGANSINWGWVGTPGRRYMGALPAAGGWVRLEVPAAIMGLDGLAVDGMAFTLFGGRATWDRVGKAS